VREAKRTRNTPGPQGPFPNISQSNTLARSSTMVNAGGAMPIDGPAKRR
jgi:hypothetical protein